MQAQLGRTINVTSMSDDFDDVWTPVPKPAPEPLTMPEDLMAMSVAWHRIRNAPGPDAVNATSVADRELIQHVTIADRNVANDIREYYSKKIMWASLHGVKTSKFKTDLGTFLHGDGKTYLETDLPMLFRIPEFYYYDLQIEKLVEGSKKPTVKYHMRNKSAALTPVKYMYKTRRSTKLHEYWFTDEDKVLHMVVLQHQNPLQHIWDRMFFKQEPMTINGFTTVAKRADVMIVQIANWTLE